MLRTAAYQEEVVTQVGVGMCIKGVRVCVLREGGEGGGAEGECGGRPTRRRWPRRWVLCVSRRRQVVAGGAAGGGGPWRLLVKWLGQLQLACQSVSQCYTARVLPCASATTHVRAGGSRADKLDTKLARGNGWALWSCPRSPWGCMVRH